MKLFKTHTLIFSIPSGNTLNEFGEIVEGTPINKSVQGSLQAIRTGGTVARSLPEGIRTSDARFFYTKTNLQLADEGLKVSSAYTTIDGKKFTIFSEEDNTGFGLKTDHYKYLLVRESPKTFEGEY